MKVLMSAYSCEPGQGSERGVGWNVVREVANHHEVWVLTRPDESKEAIEAELAGSIPNLHFVYFTLPIWGGGWRWGANGAMQIHYYFWQIQAYFVARQLHRQIGFDVIHHVTFVKYSNPSFLSLLRVPFVWGPVGGGESAPMAFWRDFSWRAKTYETVRSLSRWLGEHDPFVYLTAKNSAIVRATTKDTAQRLNKLGVEKVEILPGIGLSEEEITKLEACPPQEDETLVRFVSIGRLLHWKGFHLGLRAFAQAKLANAEYWIIGDGPERDRLKALAQELEAQQVKFLGMLPREETLNRLGECHVLVHPSLHDSGGGVCLEAMAAGRPVICLGIGGPAVLVTEKTGIIVLAQEPHQTVRDLAKAITCLAENSALRFRMGTAGQRLVRENYSWQTKGKNLAQLYEKILSSHFS